MASIKNQAGLIDPDECALVVTTTGKSIELCIGVYCSRYNTIQVLKNGLLEPGNRSYYAISAPSVSELVIKKSTIEQMNKDLSTRLSISKLHTLLQSTKV